MIVLDAMDLEAGRPVHGEVHEQHWRTAGTPHGGRRWSRQAFMAGDVLGMLAAREPDLPLPHRLHQQPHDRAHGQRRNPCGFLQPHRADRRGMRAPAPARFHRDMVFLICLEPRGIRTDCWPHGGGQDRPPLRILGGSEGLWGHDAARAGLDLGCVGLRRTAST